MGAVRPHLFRSKHKVSQPVGPSEHQARVMKHLLQRLWLATQKIFESPRLLDRASRKSSSDLFQIWLRADPTVTEQRWPMAPRGRLATQGPLPSGAKVHRCT